MSDELSMYELEDIIWDDFDRGDDHIVPHRTNPRTNRNSFEGDSCKIPRFETNPVLCKTNASNTISQKEAENKKKKMMEKESFDGSCDGEIVKNMPNLACDDAKMSNNCFNNSYSYPLSQEGDVCFVDNNCSNKESGDLMYYGWSEIGNFEDVDKMLRSCDSSFGLGIADNDSWFTSDRIESNEETLKMNFKFPSSEPSGFKDILPDIDSGTPESNSNDNRSSCISESNNEVSFKVQKKHQNPTEGKEAGQGQNDGSFYQMSDLTDIKFDQVLTSADYGNLVDSFGHVQSNTCYQTASGQMQSNIKSENKGQMMFQSTTSEVENKSDIEGEKKGAEIGWLEGCSASCELDEISLEATSFRQLRQAMEQLDLRTKLCIRDSLYRLATSAEQRHNNNNYNNPSLSSDINDVGGSLMDIETDTNPIDRSIAHLLFHRPSESPNLPPNPNLKHGVCEEEAAAGGSNDNWN